MFSRICDLIIIISFAFAFSFCDKIMIMINCDNLRYVEYVNVGSISLQSVVVGNVWPRVDRSVSAYSVLRATNMING